MASTVKIGGDTSGLDAALSKAQMSVGKATAGIGKGLAAAVGSSLGPWGELIEKADMFRTAIGGVSIGTRIFAGVVGTAFVGAAYLVDKAIDIVQKYREQLEINKRLREEMKQEDADFLTRLNKEGVETQNVAHMTEFLTKKRKALADENQKIAENLSGLDFPSQETEKVFTDAIQKNLNEIKSIEETILKIREQSSQEMANQAAFQRNISDEAAKIAQQRGIEGAAKITTAANVQQLRQQALAEFDAGVAAGGRQGAERVNAATNTLNTLDKIAAEIERQNKGQTENQKGQVRFTELASVGGGSAMGGISARQDATKDIVANGKTTNQLLRELRDVWRNLNLR